MCSFYLDLQTPSLVRKGSFQVPYSHGVRFEPEVPFGNPRYSFNIHSARLAARGCLLGEELPGPTSPWS